MAETVLVVQPRGGGEALEEVPADIITYGERLNLPGAVQFNLAMEHEVATSAKLNPGEHEVVIKRNTSVVWAGPLTTVVEPPKPESGDWLLSFGGEGLLHYPWRWFITSTLEFTAEDQFEIARALIEHHQNKAGGDFGIDTSAVTLSGVDRDRTYPGFELKNVGEALQQLAEVDGGFDYAIDPATRELVLYYPRKGSRQSDLIWDERNIRSFARSKDWKSQASQMLGVGSGEGDAALRASAQDSSAVATFGLTQEKYSNTSVSDAATLQAHVVRELALFKNSAEMIALVVDTDEPEVFSYGIGDEGQVRWPSSYEPVNKFMRLVGRDIVWESGEERAILYLEGL